MKLNDSMPTLIIGVDEAGRGPLAGPVFAAAVCLDSSQTIIGLRDSKQLSAKQRERLKLEIEQKAFTYAVAQAEVSEIDQLNIFQATLLAMQRAVSEIFQRYSYYSALIYIDGNHAPTMPWPTQTIIKGDQLEPAISAASILAKVSRDQEMLHYDSLYPQYGFAQHKGYGTAQHLQAIQEWGITPIHRQSFAPVKNAILLNV